MHVRLRHVRILNFQLRPLFTSDVIAVLAKLPLHFFVPENSYKVLVLIKVSVSPTSTDVQRQICQPMLGFTALVCKYQDERGRKVIHFSCDCLAAISADPDTGAAHTRLGQGLVTTGFKTVHFSDLTAD